MIDLGDRPGHFRPGRKVMTVVHAIVAGGTTSTMPTCCAAADREGLAFRVMAPSTLGSFLRAFTFGHVRQLEAVVGETLRRAWSLGAGPGRSGS